MAYIVQLFVVSCCVSAGIAVIASYCPPYCVCHETVWRCSSRRVTEWPLDNLTHIVMRGVTTQEMSKSNIDVLPNWPPTDNFPDLATVFLADTVFDGERCHELECLQKLNLFVLSSCPANLRQECSRAPCCFWSTPTTRRSFSTTAIGANTSTAFPTLQESSFTRPMDSTPADVIGHNMVSLFGFATYFLFCLLVIPTMSQMSGMGLGLHAAKFGQVKPGIWTNGKSYSLGVGVPIINNGINRPSVGIGASMGGNFKGGSKPNYNVGIGVNIPIGNKARPAPRRRN